MNQQAEIHIFINYSNPDKIRTDLKLFKKMYMTPVQALALHRALLYVPDEIKKILETILTDFAW